jgi:SAM-dependent MidA family methyltransferase
LPRPIESVTAEQSLPTPSPGFIAAFREHVGAEGMMSFAGFMDLALYDPETGYYATRRRRVGREVDTDFFTATSLGPVFGELVVAACVDLLGQQPPADCSFVEIGTEPAEPSKFEDSSATGGRSRPTAVPEAMAGQPPPAQPLDPWRRGLGAPGATDGPAVRPYHQAGSQDATGVGGVLAPGMRGTPPVANPFAGIRNLSLGQSLEIPPVSIVFSNELFDAQPCHRLVREAGRWRETGVAYRSGVFEEVLMPELSTEAKAVQDQLPASAPEGYRIDLPIAAARLAAAIASKPWTGLFVAFDYGKSWQELSEDTPQGTVRSYFRHRQGNDLLNRPGEQDLTCHVCWDWIAGALTARGFEPPMLESQEAFFVHHAAPALSRVTAAEATRLSPRKLSVMQLLHPGNMGQKFQVLWARRKLLPAVGS